MTKTMRRFLLFGWILAFSLLALGINFFHTEDSLSARKECPACHFQMSSVSLSPAVFFTLPPLICLGTLPVDEPVHFGEHDVLRDSSRSPPSA